MVNEFRIGLLFLLVLLAGCGFQPRGVAERADLSALSPLYVQGLPLSDNFSRVLRKRLTDAQVRLASTRGEATQVLHLFGRDQSKRVQSIDARGKSLEYELTEAVSFSLGETRDDFDKTQAPRITIRRAQTNPQTETLARQIEERELRRQMQREMADRLLRRLAAQARQ
jgi:outer membrane lipopolysaccharide assembly protein LptE/RlpB